MTAASRIPVGRRAPDDIGRSVVVTGASGVMGSALLAELGTALCLTHVAPADAHGSRQIPCDLGQPRLGLSPCEYGELARETDSIVHCAGVTDFRAGREATRRVNVEGTERVLDLAARADAPIYHVSTAFVERAAVQQPHERDDGRGPRGPETYLASKREAERLVRDSGAEAVIVRPSVVAGDSLTGEIARFQGIHLIGGAIARGVLPLLPLRREDRIDFLPQDRVARALAGLVRGRHTGGEYWLTAGGEAPTTERMCELSCELGRQLGFDASPPRLVEPETIDRLIRPAFIEKLPTEAQDRFDEMVGMTSLYLQEKPFPSSIRELERLLGLDLMPDLEESFRRSMTYWAAQKGLVGESGPSP